MYSSKLLFFLFALCLGVSVYAQDSTASYIDDETEASYPGGNEAWKKYVQKNMSSKVPEKDAPIGIYQVIARFVVTKDGSVSDIKAETKFGYGMEDEVIRVIEGSGKWIPAVQNGKSINAYRRQPVTFVVNSDDFTVTGADQYKLYTNTDNTITIAAKKVKAEDIGVNIRGIKAVPLGAGRFIIRTNKPGRLNMEIVNTKKDDAVVGEVSFEVVAK